MLSEPYLGKSLASCIAVFGRQKSFCLLVCLFLHVILWLIKRGKAGNVSPRVLGRRQKHPPCVSKMSPPRSQLNWEKRFSEGVEHSFLIDFVTLHGSTYSLSFFFSFPRMKKSSLYSPRALLPVLLGGQKPLFSLNHEVLSMCSRAPYL